MSFYFVSQLTHRKRFYSMMDLVSLLTPRLSPKTAQANGHSVWEQAFDRAERLAHSSGTGKKIASELVNAQKQAYGDFGSLTKNIRKLVATQHPFLNTVNQFYLSANGKLLRPLIVLLLAKALEPMTMVQVGEKTPSPTPVSVPCPLFDKQQKLAQITEMIHIASLMHDDVLDAAHSRRGLLAAPLAFGNKAAVLSGDYLLAMASMELAKLGNLKVVETMASIIADLVHGEFMQLDVPFSSAFQFDYYIEKSFRKTASLIANSCKSAALLANQPETIQDAVYEFGKGLGVAFQASHLSV